MKMSHVNYFRKREDREIRIQFGQNLHLHIMRLIIIKQNKQAKAIVFRG